MDEPEAALVRKFARGLGDVLAGRHATPSAVLDQVFADERAKLERKKREEGVAPELLAAWMEASRLAHELADATGRPVRFNVDGRAGCEIVARPSAPRGAYSALAGRRRQIERLEELAAFRLEEILRLRREREEIRIDRSLREALKPIPSPCEPEPADCPRDAEQRPPLGEPEPPATQHGWLMRGEQALSTEEAFEKAKDAPGRRGPALRSLAERRQ